MIARTLLHVTLATGDVRRSPRHEVGDDAIAAVRPLLASGGSLPAPFAAYRLIVSSVRGALVFTVEGPAGPLVTCGVAATDEAAGHLWPGLADVQARTGAWESIVERPDAVPWLGVVILAGLGADPDAVEWLGDLERCVAWAWLEGRDRA